MVGYYCCQLMNMKSSILAVSDCDIFYMSFLAVVGSCCTHVHSLCGVRCSFCRGFSCSSILFRSGMSCSLFLFVADILGRNDHTRKLKVLQVCRQ